MNKKISGIYIYTMYEVSLNDEFFHEFCKWITNWTQHIFTIKCEEIVIVLQRVVFTVFSLTSIPRGRKEAYGTFFSSNEIS